MTENKGDLISREALKKALKSNCKPELCGDYGKDYCRICCPHNDFEDLIDNAPTVETFKEKYEELKEAYRLLAEAYEHEVTTERPKGDLISRDALKEALQNREECKECTDIDCIHCFYDIIDNAPIVETEEVAKLKRENTALEQEMLYCRENWKKAERPQGEWIKNDGRDLRDCFYTCSKCGRNINVICGETLEDYPFCHCGADMRGKKE